MLVRWRWAHAYDFLYHVVVRKEVRRTLNPRDPYTTELTLETDEPEQGSAQRHKLQLSDRLVTAADAERLFESDTEVRSKLFYNGEVLWVKNDVSSGQVQTVLTLGQTSLTGEGAGAVLLETLTGISLPSSEYGWVLQNGRIFEGGDTFLASIDAQDGRWVSVAEIRGTSLLGVFGG